jgi:hypothetical protein
MTRRAAALLVVAAVLLVGCPRRPPAPVLDDAWPERPGAYDEVTATWTRSGSFRADYQLVAEVHALLKAPAWRAAWVAERAAKGRLAAPARDELMTAQRQAHEEAFEVVLVVTTWDRRENDLDRGARSVWRVVLVDGAGREIEPIDIRRDRRPDMVLRTEYRGYGDFARAYVARFPRSAALLGPGVTRVGLRMSSPRGGIELTWHGPR